MEKDEDITVLWTIMDDTTAANVRMTDGPDENLEAVINLFKKILRKIATKKSLKKDTLTSLQRRAFILPSTTMN